MQELYRRWAVPTQEDIAALTASVGQYRLDEAF
jgi:hypothetical protein